MGAGQSTLNTATEELKDRVGLFSLRSNQKQFLQGLSVFLKLILSKNSIYDLQPVLTNPSKCKEFIVVLSSVLKKEFHLLRLPDASTRGETHKVPFMMRSKYDKLDEDPLRQGVCKEIAWFILRFVTLATSLAASVHINPKMPDIFQQVSRTLAQSTMNKSFKEPVFPPEVKERINAKFYALDSSLISNYVANGIFKHVMTNINGVEHTDPRPLYYIESNQESSKRVVINSDYGIVYAPLGSNSGVYFIRFEIVEGPKKPTTPQLIQVVQPPSQYAIEPQVRQYNPIVEPQVRQYNPIVEPQVRQYNPTGEQSTNTSRQNIAQIPRVQSQQPLRLFTRNSPSEIFNNATSLTSRVSQSVLGGKRRTNKNYKSLRRTRKTYKGGAFENVPYYRVKLYNAFRCTQGTCEQVDTFYMLPNGSTVDEENYLKLKAGADTLSVNTKTFADRLQSKLLQGETTALETPREQSGPTSDFLPIYDTTFQTYENLKKIEDTINTRTEGTSPAQYRAYLLATKFEKAPGEPDKLFNMFCKDIWATKKTTEIVPFALLEALYVDRQDGNMESASRDELRTIVRSAIGEKVLEDAAPSGTSSEKLSQTRFPQIPKTLDPYCTQISSSPANTGERFSIAPEDKEILIQAHKDLRDLFDAHLQNVIDIFKKIVIPRRATYSYTEADIQLQLTPEFESDPRGAIVFLEEVIKDARDKLSKHFIAVEKVYQTALQKIRERIEGRYKSPTRS